jgi:hypothetical protein
MTAVYTCQSVIIVGLSSRAAVTPRVSVRRRLPSRRTPRRSVRNNSARLQYRCALAGSSIRRFNRQHSRHVAVRVAKWSTHVKRVCSLTLLRHFARTAAASQRHSHQCTDNYNITVRLLSQFSMLFHRTECATGIRFTPSHSRCHVMKIQHQRVSMSPRARTTNTARDVQSTQSDADPTSTTRLTRGQRYAFDVQSSSERDPVWCVMGTMNGGVSCMSCSQTVLVCTLLRGDLGG